MAEMQIECQGCHKLGGHPVSFRYDGREHARWVCPHCIDELHEENQSLRSILETIERRLVEGYAPSMPWSNEEMALGIVREERAKGKKA